MPPGLDASDLDRRRSEHRRATDDDTTSGRRPRSSGREVAAMSIEPRNNKGGHQARHRGPQPPRLMDRQGLSRRRDSMASPLAESDRTSRGTSRMRFSPLPLASPGTRYHIDRGLSIDDAAPVFENGHVDRRTPAIARSDHRESQATSDRELDRGGLCEKFLEEAG